MKRTALILILSALFAIPTLGVEPHEIRVPMSDGVDLAADLYLPSDDGPHPVILIRTPYGKRAIRVFAEHFVAAGYAVVIQDVRGKFDSGGEFVPFLHDEKDGLETLDFIAGSEWSDGHVGMFGSSYLARAGLLLARHGHPSLKAVFSASGWIDSDEINSPGGAFHMMLAIPWLLFNEGQAQRPLRDFDIKELFHVLPVRDVFQSIGLEVRGWDPQVMRAGAGSSGSGVSIPVFHLTGWYDFVSPASLSNWRAMRDATDHPQPLLLGPWVHDQIYTRETAVGEIDAGESSILGVDGLMRLAIDWFDCHLRQTCTNRPPVRIFVLGENQWHDFEDWPPRASRTRSFYLQSRGKAASSPADGRLDPRPQRRSGQDQFIFDPNNPVPTAGGANFHFFPEVNGPRDQRELEARDDVLVYTTAPLDSDLLIAGPVRAILHVSTEGRDTDFTAKLVSVDPDGSARNILDGILRLSYRNGRNLRQLVEPGRIYEITVDLGEIAMRVPRGHRLRLDITSSNFPKFDRNPNTGEEPFDAAVLRSVQQTIHHGRIHPSRLEITTLAVENRPIERTGPPQRTQRSVMKPSVADPTGVRAGVALLEAGDAAGAAADFEEHLKSAPGAALLHFWLGRARLAEGELDRAIEALEQAVELEPDRSDHHLWLGRAFVQQLQNAGNHQKAGISANVRRSYERAVELDPSSVDARTSLAGYYLSAPALAGGSTRKAKEQVDAIIAIDPARGQLLLAQIHLQRKEWDEAEAAYRRVLEVGFATADVQFELGRMYQDRERWTEAVESFEAATAANPDHALAWYQLGRTGAISGEHLDRALEAIEIFIERFSATADPAYEVGSWWRKGMILEKQRRTDEAIAAYQRALELDPNHQEARKAGSRLAGR